MSEGIYWLASYPKSGNTWLRTFISNLLSDADKPVEINHLIGDHAADRHWLDDVLGLSSADLSEDELQQLRPAVYQWGERLPRYVKIHDAYSYCADGSPLIGRHGTAGAVYLVRNPLDVVPSLANHFGCDLERALAIALDSEYILNRDPKRYLAQTGQWLSCWSGHVRSWLEQTDVSVHVMRYEDMLDKPLQTFASAARFLGLPHDSQAVAKALRFSDFEVLVEQERRGGFRERISNQPFFNKGKSGYGRSMLSPQQIQRILQAHAPMMERFGYLDSGAFDEQGR